MVKYNTLIFDLDDTLIDNNESVKFAFKVISKELGVTYTDSLFKNWKAFDIEYWHGWESDKIPIPKSIINLEDKITYLRANRFKLFFKDLDLSLKKCIDINELYCEMLGENIVEIDGASTLLSELKNNYKVYIGTNGPKNAALKKLEKAKLDSFILDVVSSEEVGFSKPKEEFFNFLIDKMETKSKSEMLLVGDSLSTDVLGGMNNNIDTCWFNYKNETLPQEFKPTYTINKLLELKRKIKM